MSLEITPRFPNPPADRRGWPWTLDDDIALQTPPAKNLNLPKTTVITPSFNQGSYLEEAIRSVILQDHPNLEYLIMDGGSTDRSVDIIERYEPWISGWVSEKDGGQADAINKGFDRATGDFICWLNSDDVMYQGFISRRVEEFSTRPGLDLIFGDIDTGWDNGERVVLRGKPPSFLEMLRTLDVAVPQQGAMWRRSTIQRLGGLDPRWHVVLDREFFLRIIRCRTAEYIPGLSGLFRQHDGAKSIADATTWVTELPLMYAELFADPALEPQAKGLERETMATVHLLCSDILRNAGDWGGSLKHLVTATTWNPSHAFSSFFAARVSGLRRRLSNRTDGSGAREEPT